MRKNRKASNIQEKGGNTTQRVKYLVLSLLAGLFLIFGIPILINELYKLDAGYFTLWGASDVLSYYASILQGLLTFVTLYLTIVFTRKQIKYEHHLDMNQDTITQIELKISAFVELLYPLNLYIIVVLHKHGESDAKFIQALITYQTNLKIAINALRCSIFSKKYPDLEPLWEMLNTFSDSMLEYAEKILQEPQDEAIINNICSQLQAQAKNEYLEIIKRKEECIEKLKTSFAESVANTMLF